MKYIIALCVLIAVIAHGDAAGRQQQQSRYQQKPQARAQARPVPAPATRASQRPASPLAQRAYANAAASGAGDQVEILSKSFDLSPDGSYNWEFESGNGISQSENGVGGQYAKGAAEWTSPEGEHIVLQYTADENGYQPSGSHVPQVPEYITRALEWIRTHPNPEYQNY